ncbi:MAG: amidohydrolase family protein [Rhodospirillales bacterium]|jgi:aminocarboxymuconate-semialdehyde decarboxylase
MASNGNLEFVGCDLHYHADKPAYDKDPSTIESSTPRPVSINGKRMTIIDMHAHCQLSNVWPLVEGREELKGEKPFEGQLKETEDISVRLRHMDEMGTDMEVLSIGTEQHFPWAEYDLAEQVAKMQNEKLTEVCAEHPDRFVPLGVVSLQHPKLAAEQLEHSVKNMGHRGCMITGNIMGEEIANSKFHPFWAKAEELDCVVFLHPRVPRTGNARLQGRGFLTNMIGNPLETTTALAHLIYEGTLDKFPGIKLAASHGGGYLASYIGRFDHGHNSKDRGGLGLEKKKPSEYLKMLYFDTLVYGTQNLAHLIEEVGVSQLMLGTDHDFGMTNRNAVAHLLSVKGLRDADIESILNGKAKELFKIDHI